MSAAVTYFLMSVLYVLLVPLLKPAFYNTRWEWAYNRQFLAAMLMQYTLSYVVPLAFGIYYYSSRRSKTRNVGGYMSMFGLQFIIALVVNLVVNFVIVGQNFVGEFPSLANDLKLIDVRVWFDILIPSLIPGIVLLVYDFTLESKYALARMTLVSFLGGALFAASQAAYELTSGYTRWFSLHQFFFGCFLTGSYLICRTVGRRSAVPSQVTPPSAVSAALIPGLPSP